MLLRQPATYWMQSPNLQNAWEVERGAQTTDSEICALPKGGRGENGAAAKEEWGTGGGDLKVSRARTKQHLWEYWEREINLSPQESSQTNIRIVQYEEQGRSGQDPIAAGWSEGKDRGSQIKREANRMLTEGNAYQSGITDHPNSVIEGGYFYSKKCSALQWRQGCSALGYHNRSADDRQDLRDSAGQ